MARGGPNICTWVSCRDATKLEIRLVWPFFLSTPPRCVSQMGRKLPLLL